MLTVNTKEVRKLEHLKDKLVQYMDMPAKEQNVRKKQNT